MPGNHEFSLRQCNVFTIDRKDRFDHKTCIVVGRDILITYKMTYKQCPSSASSMKNKNKLKTEAKPYSFPPKFFYTVFVFEQ